MDNTPIPERHDRVFILDIGHPTTGRTVHRNILLSNGSIHVNMLSKWFDKVERDCDVSMPPQVREQTAWNYYTTGPIE